MPTDKEFERQVQQELIDIRSKIPNPAQRTGGTEELYQIWERVTKSIATTIVSDGWSDIRNSSGPKRMRELEMFIAGYKYANTGDLPAEYFKVIFDWKRENDPEYKKYLELKSKFEGK